MLEMDLYKTMTMKDLIKTMEKLRTLMIDGRRILFPLTKREKDIYHPVSSIYRRLAVSNDKASSIL